VKRPDFFIVGAFKAGTTSLYRSLRQHPQVFLPFHKEPMFFGADLTPRYERMSERQYLALFEEAREDQCAGEASPWYLYSRTAAEEIRHFAPSARIIVMLRNPVDVMHAQHSQLLFNRREDLTDFAEALRAEADRRAGRRIPTGALRPEALFYRHSVRFAEQLERYLGAFGRDRIHVIVFDDFVADTAAAYRAVLDFLGVDPDFNADLAVQNENRRARLGLAHRLAFRPPGPLRRLVPLLRRSAKIHRLRDRLVALDSRPASRAELDAELRRSLTRELAPEIDRLGNLIGRDLSAWTA
jgi:hypothetical protein